MSPAVQVAASRPRRLIFGPLPIDVVTREQALDVLEALVDEGRGGAVFTPNVDHMCLAEESARMRDAYSRVDLSLADGMPLVWASRLLGNPLPEKVSGSDFVPVVLERAAARGWRVFFLGGAPGVAALARERLRTTLPGLQVVGTDAPRIDVDDPPSAHRQQIENLLATAPHIVLVALGAPKQELWIDAVRESVKPAVLLAIGASLDFVAGTVPRAPKWLSEAGFEWLFRLTREPQRLWRRYLLRDPKFALILARAIASRARDPRSVAP